MRGPPATMTRGDEAAADRPDRHRRFAAEQSRADRGGDDVVQGNPREVGDEQKQRQQIARRQIRAPHATPRSTARRVAVRAAPAPRPAAAPKRRPITMIAIAVPWRTRPARLAPTCSVVATTLAPTKIRKRSSGVWRRSPAATAPARHFARQHNVIGAASCSHCQSMRTWTRSARRYAQSSRGGRDGRARRGQDDARAAGADRRRATCSCCSRDAWPRARSRGASPTSRAGRSGGKWAGRSASIATSARPRSCWSRPKAS